MRSLQILIPIRHCTRKNNLNEGLLLESEEVGIINELLSLGDRFWHPDFAYFCCFADVFGFFDIIVGEKENI